MTGRVEVYQRIGYGWEIDLYANGRFVESQGWWSERTARRHAGRMLRQWRRDHREA